MNHQLACEKPTFHVIGKHICMLLQYFLKLISEEIITNTIYAPYLYRTLQICHHTLFFRNLETPCTQQYLQATFKHYASFFYFQKHINEPYFRQKNAP